MMSFTAWTFSAWNVYHSRLRNIRPDALHITLETIYKSLPSCYCNCRVQPGLHSRCGWFASKTHKPTHIPERVSLPCLHKTIMSEIFLCSLNTWSLQFGEMAVWLSGLEACPDTVLSSRLPTVSAHTLQLCEPTVPCSQAWVGTEVLTGSLIPPTPSHPTNPPTTTSTTASHCLTLSLCPVILWVQSSTFEASFVNCRSIGKRQKCKIVQVTQGKCRTTSRHRELSKV